MKRHFTGTFVFALILSVFSCAVSAQEVSEEQKPENNQPKIVDPATFGPKNVIFVEKFGEWKEYLKEMVALKLEFQTAKDERKIEIETVYHEKLKQGEKMRKEMIESAIAAFEEAPYQNLDTIQFMFGLLEWEYSRDNYDKSYQIAKMLIEKAPEGEKINPPVYFFGGMSALLIADCDKADEWMKHVQESGKMEELLRLTDDDNNSKMSQLASFEKLKEKWAVEKEIRKKEAEAPEEMKNPRLLMKTSKGDVTLELFENEAPNTVANFISLAEKGFYDNVPFHRVLPGFMAQTGNARLAGKTDIDYVIDCECYQENARKHFRGSLSMAHPGRPNLNGSQFFITYVPTHHLDASRNGGHTVFGRVVDGMDVISDISRIDPDDQSVAIEPDKIISVEVLNKRNHEYKPVTKPNPLR